MLVRRLLEVALILLPLVCWPNLEQPFSTPKLWLLAAVDLLVAVYWLRHGKALGAPGWPWLAWLAALAASAVAAPYVSYEALLLAALPIPLFWSPLPADRLGRALLYGSAIQSVIALLQYCRLDPLRLPGWSPEVFPNARMRVYGTLGNPDFVAAFLCTTLPLYAGVKSRTWLAAGLALQVAAILATGSRISLFALPVAAGVLVWRGVRPRRWWLAGIPAAAVLLWLAPARPLGVTLQGRFYLARVAAAHVTEMPLIGFGPGAFELQFAKWQAAWLSDPVNRERDARFAGPVDHAHNDYVEMAVDYGPVGLAAFLVLCGWLITAAPKHRPPGAWAGLAALLAIACFDFPFHRPAEWALFWLLLSCGTDLRRGHRLCLQNG